MSTKLVAIHSAFLYSLILMFSIIPNAVGQIIHWEFTEMPLPTDSGSIKGGFDFNTSTYDIFNITVQTGNESGLGCFPCNNFTGATGSYIESYNPDGTLGTYSITLEETFQSGALVDRHYILTIIGNIYFGSTSPFNFKTVGVMTDLTLNEIGFVRLGEEYGPDDIYDTYGCLTCVTATGELIPVPEPYTMFLTGLGLIGFAAKRKSRLSS
ncbi:MAG TPA: PEP-CTERM sorting domain-containing protein [Methylotenera sp.]